MRNFILFLLIVILAVFGVWYFSRNGEESPEAGITAEERPAELITEDEGEPVEEVSEFNLTASNFKYDITEIRVKKGDRVRINLTAQQGLHDWVVDEFNVGTDQIQAGQTASVEFVADRQGDFEYYCSLGSHRSMGMVGRLIVE